MPTERFRIGEQIQLPSDVRAFTVKEIQDETVSLEFENSGSNDATSELPQQVRHDIRNHLQAISIGVRLLRDELTTGDTKDAEETFAMIQEHLAVLTEHPVLAKT